MNKTTEFLTPAGVVGNRTPSLFLGRAPSPGQRVFMCVFVCDRAIEISRVFLDWLFSRPSCCGLRARALGFHFIVGLLVNGMHGLDEPIDRRWMHTRARCRRYLFLKGGTASTFCPTVSPPPRSWFPTMGRRACARARVRLSVPLERVWMAWGVENRSRSDYGWIENHAPLTGVPCCCLRMNGGAGAGGDRGMAASGVGWQEVTPAFLQTRRQLPTTNQRSGVCSPICRRTRQMHHRPTSVLVNAQHMPPTAAMDCDCMLTPLVFFLKLCSLAYLLWRTYRLPSAFFSIVRMFLVLLFFPRRLSVS
ncbi:unnamed protein product [Ectocarpus sp. 6 AP-2014]